MDDLSQQLINYFFNNCKEHYTTVDAILQIIVPYIPSLNASHDNVFHYYQQKTLDTFLTHQVIFNESQVFLTLDQQSVDNLSRFLLSNTRMYDPESVSMAVEQSLTAWHDYQATSSWNNNNSSCSKRLFQSEPLVMQHKYRRVLPTTNYTESSFNHTQFSNHNNNTSNSNNTIQHTIPETMSSSSRYNNVLHYEDDCHSRHHSTMRLSPLKNTITSHSSFSSGNSRPAMGLVGSMLNSRYTSSSGGGNTNYSNNYSSSFMNNNSIINNASRNTDTQNENNGLKGLHQLVSATTNTSNNNDPSSAALPPLSSVFTTAEKKSSHLVEYYEPQHNIMTTATNNHLPTYSASELCPEVPMVVKGLEVFKEIYDTNWVPANFVVPTSESHSWPEELHQYKLGEYVKLLRTHLDILPTSDASALTKAGIIWTTTIEGYPKACVGLKIYHIIYKTFRVPYRYIVPHDDDGHNWPTEFAGMKLGGQINNARKLYHQSKLAEHNIQLLSNAGMVWERQRTQTSVNDPERIKMIVFGMRKYSELNDGRTITMNFTVPSSSNNDSGWPDDMKGVKLGSLLYTTNRCHKHGQLLPENVKLLEDAGMVWRL